MPAQPWLQTTFVNGPYDIVEWIEAGKELRIPPCSLPAPGQSLSPVPAMLRVLCEVRFSVRGFARHLGVCSRTLERHLKAELGCCPRQWLRRLRMTEARRRLLEVRCAKVVALELGYSQPAHFTVAFRAYWGVTPSDYLLAHGGAKPLCRILESDVAFSIVPPLV